MSYMIKDLPKEELPRERLIKYGVEALSDQELISIIMRTGTRNKSVKELSLDLLKKYNLKDMKNISFKSLSSIKGIGSVKAVSLLAALELGRRSVKDNKDIVHINSSYDAYSYAKYDMEDNLQEKFMVIYLDTRKNIINSRILFIGSVDSSYVNPRDVFREAVKNNASFMILVHNHPGLSINPSFKDEEVTSVIINLGKMMGIRVLDHIIIGKDEYYSFLEDGHILFKNN